MTKSPRIAFKVVVCLLLALTCISCASLRYASKKAEDSAKEFTPAKGKASLYVYRGASADSGFLVFGFNCRRFSPNFANDRLFQTIAWLYPDTFVKCELEPGAYKLAALNQHEFNRLRHRRLVWNPKHCSLTLEADKLYFLRLGDDAEILQAGDAKDLEAIRRCRLVTSSIIRPGWSQP